MAFTYNISELSENPLYQVRFQLWDNVEEIHSFEDEELQFLLDQASGDVDKACILACDKMLAKLASATDYKLGPYTENGSDARYNRWLTLKKTFVAAQTSYNAPIAQQPTTSPIFGYDMMSVDCCADGSDE